MRSKKQAQEPDSTFIERARRQQIIEATIAVVAEDGYAGTSLSKVAERAKISKSVVIYYFEGKNQLLETTVHQVYEEIWKFVKPRLDAEKTAAGKLRAHIESEFAFLEKHRPSLLTVSNILLNHRDRHGVLYLREQAEEDYLKIMGLILEQGQSNGEFRKFAVRPMAATLMHAINGTLDHWAADPKMSLSEYVGELVRIFELATQNHARSRAVRRF
jgi:TetR/AcrR family fatty acid metabolism transcriptional regulator